MESFCLLKSTVLQDSLISASKAENLDVILHPSLSIIFPITKYCLLFILIFIN